MSAIILFIEFYDCFKFSRRECDAIIKNRGRHFINYVGERVRVQYLGYVLIVP